MDASNVEEGEEISVSMTPLDDVLICVWYDSIYFLCFSQSQFSALTTFITCGINYYNS